MRTILPVALLPALALAAVFALPAQYGETWLAGLPLKAGRLREAAGPRIVAVGGSSAAFGLRCDLLEEALPGWQAVNLGLYAGLGTAPMLDLALPDVRPGDVVLITPEQNAQTLSGYFNPRAMWQAAEAEPALLLRLNGERAARLAGDLLPFAAEKARFALAGTPPAGDGIYRRSAFNAWGDVAAPHPANIMPGGVDADMPIRFDEGLLTADFAGELNRFARACMARGARVYYRFCPMNAAAVADPADIPDYEVWLEERLCFPVLGRAADSVLEAAWFYDTNFHLNEAGAVYYTARLAEELRAALSVTGDAPIPLPQPPALSAAPGAEADSADAACFTWRVEQDSAVPTGLTELGLTRSELRFPAAAEGLPVTLLPAGVLKGAEHLETLVLPDSLRHIEDGAFAGCTALTRIELRQPVPSRCTVGSGLLSGSGALVYVPAESLGAYMTSYFWSPLADRLRPLPGETAAAGESDQPLPQAEEGSRVIRCHGGGGLTSAGADSVTVPASMVHLRTNTPMGQRLFTRPGYTPLCWNTRPDLTGERVSFGSRTDAGALWLEWVPTAPEADFEYVPRDCGAAVTAYTGSAAVCAVPDTLGGLPVRRVAAGAFAGAGVETVILPPGLLAVERGAFSGAALREIWLYDSLTWIYDESFSGCDALETLHVSADTRPVYSKSYFAAFADKLDRLRTMSAPRLVLFGGSAVRYGYSCEALRAAFPAWEPVNMGVYAYTNALPQYRLIARFLEAGDVLLSCPEFDTTSTQFCLSNALDDRTWAMLEADYGAAALLDVRQYTAVFDSLRQYLSNRRMMPDAGWEQSPAGWDDDGNASAVPTYNRYGDYTLPREGGTEDVLLQTYLADYTVDAFPDALVNALNAVYDELSAAQVQVLFTYAPRSHSALTADSTPEKRRALDESLRARLHAPVLLGIEDALYPATLCYLIDNHLSSEGMRIHTAKMTEALAPWLGEPAAR